MAKKSLVGTPIVSKRLLSDVLIWMVDNERNYCCTGIEITNSTGAKKTYPVGTVVANAALADASDPATLQPAFTDALTLEQITLEDGQSGDVPALVRGPALVNFNEVQRSTSSESDAALKTRLAHLITQGIRFKTEPTQKTVADRNG